MNIRSVCLKAIVIVLMFTSCVYMSVAQRESTSFSLGLSISESEALRSMTERDASANEILSALLTLKCDSIVTSQALSPLSPAYILFADGTTRRDAHVVYEVSNNTVVQTVDSARVVLVLVLERGEAQRGLHKFEAGERRSVVLTDLYFGNARPEFFLTEFGNANSGLVLRAYVHRTTTAGQVNFEFEPGEYSGESKKFLSLGVSPALVSQPESSFVVSDSAAALDPDAPHEIATYGRAVLSLHMPRGRVYYARPFWEKPPWEWYKHLSIESGIGFLFSDVYFGGSFNVFKTVEISVGTAIIDRPNSTDERRLKSIGLEHLTNTLPEIRQKNLFVGITMPIWML